jgi:peptide/nickel transport system substrate-binding protein
MQAGRMPYLFVLAAAVSLYAGCTRPPGNSTSKPLVRLAIGAALPVSGSVSGLPALRDSLFIGEPLVSTGLDGRPSARIASGWQWLNDGRTLRVTLRPNVFLHNGEKLSAELVARILSPRPAGAGLSYGSITSITASGPYQVDFNLSRPEAFLLSDLMGESIQIRDPSNRTHAIGTGPFYFSSDKPYPVLRAFDKYYQGRPAIDEIAIKPYQSQRQAWAAMMRGEIDALHEVSREAADFVEAETTVRAFSFTREFYVPLVFNVRHPVLQQREVRIALNEAVNKQAVVKDAMRGRGEVADSPIWPRHWAHSSAQPTFAYNPDAARVRLDAAGFPLRTPPSGSAEMPNRFSFTCLMYGDDPRFERIGLVVQKQLFDVGVDMRLQPVSMRELGERVSRGDFDAFLFEMNSARSLNWVYLFWHSPPEGPFLKTGYSSADAALDRLRYAQSDEETRVGTAELQRVFFEDPPAVFLAWEQATRAVSTKFVVPDDPGRDVIGLVRLWRPASDLRASR